MLLFCLGRRGKRVVSTAVSRVKTGTCWEPTSRGIGVLLHVLILAPSCHDSEHSKNLQVYTPGVRVSTSILCGACSINRDHRAKKRYVPIVPLMSVLARALHNIHKPSTKTQDAGALTRILMLMTKFCAPVTPSRYLVESPEGTKGQNVRRAYVLTDFQRGCSPLMSPTSTFVNRR